MNNTCFKCNKPNVTTELCDDCLLGTSKNTVTKETIENLYKQSEKKVETYWEKCTVMTVQLPNGFTIVEHSACVDPANYDEQIGLEICERKIKDKLWELEGYVLQTKLGKL